MIAGKRMEKDDGRAVSSNFVRDFGVVAAQLQKGDYMSVRVDQRRTGEAPVSS